MTGQRKAKGADACAGDARVGALGISGILPLGFSAAALFAIAGAMVCTRSLFPDFDMAFANQLPLTFSGEAGCAAGFAIAWAIRRRGPLDRALLGFAVACCATGVSLSLLLRAGVLVPHSAAALLAGDFAASMFLAVMACIWWRFAIVAGERGVLACAGAGMVAACAAVLLACMLPAWWEMLVFSVAAPAVLCLSFVPVVFGSKGADTCSKDGEPCSGEPGKVPPIVVAAVALSVFASDLEMNLFPISLFYEGVVFDSLPLPALLLAGVLPAFIAVCALITKRGSLPLPFVYASGFLLVAMGILCMPYRFQGGFPLSLSAMGLLAVLLYAAIVAIRFEASGVTAAFRLAGAAIAAMLASDAVVVLVQLMPGFDYGDFVFRTVFSGCCIGVLFVLALVLMPRVDRALDARSAESGHSAREGGVAADPKGRCERLARAYELSARETEVLNLLAAGRDVPYIERELVVAKSTVKTHIKHIYAKCGVSSRQSLLDLLEDFEEQK